MSKILQILLREYTTRVRKRAFIIMSIIGPLLFAALLIAPYKLASLDDNERKHYAMVELDEFSQSVSRDKLVFHEIIPSKENLQFQYLPDVDTATIRTLIEYSGYDGVIVLNQTLVNEASPQIELYTKKHPSIGTELHINSSIENFLFERKLQRLNIKPEEINSCKTKVSLNTHRFENGDFRKQNLVNLKRGIGYAAGFLIYFFIFLFGAQVMRGVIEEKTSRIIEVIITSVRPFQLMMGKIAGIALVGLTQFVAWVVLTIGIYQFALHSFIDIPQSAISSQSGVQAAGTFDAYMAINSLSLSFYFYLLGMFVFYFIFGYLLYGAMFAAIGSAVDSETDTQQFMLPVTIPLIISMIVMVNAITNPEGELIYWFSIIPFTSPIVMMARVPFNPPLNELVLSMILLVVTFIAITWLAGKIYRTGILMYGKRSSYREIIKWMRYK